MAGDWGEVVTRYPYRKVGMDHLLSRSMASFVLVVSQVTPVGEIVHGSLFSGFQAASAA